MPINRNELVTGAIFIALGIFFGVNSLLKLQMGTGFRLGPGFFPVVLAGLLVMLGIIVALRGHAVEPVPMPNVPWRGVLLVGFSPLLFGLTIRGLGLFPAVLLTTLATAFASRRMRVNYAILLCAGLAVFCVLIFNFGLDVSVPIVGPWLMP